MQARSFLVERPVTLVGLLPPCLHWHANGEIRLTGHRLGLYRIIYHYNQGFTAEMLSCQFPTLELALIHKVIVIYLEHRDEVNRYVAGYHAEIDELRTNGRHAPSVTDLRKRLEAREHAQPVEADRT